MASSGWQGDVTLTDGGFGYSYFKGNLRIDSITHSGNTVTVTGAFGVHNDGGPNSYYVYPINAAVNGSTSYQQVVPGNEWIDNGEWVTSNVSFSFSAAATATSANIEVLWNYNNGTASNSITYTLYFDASVSPPTGLNVTNITAGRDYVNANVGISSWGVGTGTRYRELQVWTYGFQEPRRYKPAYGDATSGYITCDNSASGSLTITPNTTYTIGGYASNGSMNTGSNSFGSTTTLPPVPSATFNSKSSTGFSFNYSLPNQGGANSIDLQYKVDSGSWASGTTITGSGTKTGQISVGGLVPNTNYTVAFRTSTSAGTSNGDTISGIYTSPNTPTSTVTYTDSRSAFVNCYLGNQGGAKTLYIEYKPDGSSTWTTGITIDSAGEKSEAFSIAGLNPNTSYTYNMRIRSSDGWTYTLSNITFTTVDVHTKMYCSVNNTAKRVKKVYCSVGGTRKRVKKIYGSVNGVCKLMWEEP